MQLTDVAIGIDLGGTTTAVGLVDSAGSVTAFDRFATLANRGPESWIARVHHSAMALCESAQASPIGVGLGSPGPLNLDSGHLIQAVNLKWSDVPLRSLLDRHFGLPALIHNDGVTATLGERWTGAACGCNDVVGITLGTGVGGGVIVGGEIQRGARHVAGHIGHIIVEPGGRPCPCGKSGCVEAYASGPAIAKSYFAIVGPERIDTSELTAEWVWKAAREGDQTALEVFSESAYFLGLAIDCLANVIDPEMIVVSGGVAQAEGILFDPLKKALAEICHSGGVAVPKISPGILGLKAGVVGAAALVYRST